VTTFSPQFTPRRVARWVLVVTALFIVGSLLWSARSVLTPFLFGIVLAYLFLPLVNRLEQRMPRWGAILVVYIVAISLIVTFFAFIVPPLIDQIRQLINAFPGIREIQAELNHLLDEYEQLLAPHQPGELSSGARPVYCQQCPVGGKHGNISTWLLPHSLLAFLCTHGSARGREGAQPCVAGLVSRRLLGHDDHF
jgi:predicted PurR-regulated permease PerM